MKRAKGVVCGLGAALLFGSVACGPSGEDASSVNAYLTKHGYFPNEELAERYPDWLPAVAEGPEDPAVAGERTVEALEIFQRAHGLEVTGIADAPTREMMEAPQCGMPFHLHPAYDDKWHHDAQWSAPYPLGGTYTYRVVGAATGLTPTQTVEAIEDAFDVWHRDIGVRFERTTSGTPHAWIRFVPIDGPGNIGARVFNNYWGGQRHSMEVDTQDTWAPGSLMFKNMIIHEIGHMLGFNHSGFNTSVMWPLITTRTYLSDDDLAAATFRYRRWRKVSGFANDVGDGPNGKWVIGTTSGRGGYSIHRWNGSSWTRTSGLAVRIAVAERPWVVNNEGRIFSRTGVTLGNMAGTGWQDESRTTRAIDIGVGLGNNAWIIGTQARGSGGNAILRFNGAGWTEVGGAASRISVGEDGTVYVVNAQGRVYRRLGITSSNPSGTSWRYLPNLAPNDFGNETGFAFDVGVARNGVAWVAGTADGQRMTFVRQEQPSTTVGGAANAFDRWVPVTGAVSAIDAYVVDEPWVIDGRREIFRRVP